jgi:thiamine biosynthesis lipoprotein
VLQPGGIALDLSGIAKGFAVDQVARSLQTLALQDFLIDIGGELYGSGQRPDGLPWRVTLPHQGTLSLNGLAVATSGDAWHAWEQAGRRYSHTLDPRSGAPVAHSLSSVTVVHTSCMNADALATAVLVLGPEDGIAFANEQGLALQLVLRGAHGPTVRCSTAWAALAA